MRLTAVMEEIDEERFRRGPRPLGIGSGSVKQPVAEGEGPQSSRVSDADREEVLLGSAGGRPRVQVRGRTGSVAHEAFEKAFSEWQDKQQVFEKEKRNEMLESIVSEYRSEREVEVRRRG